MKKLTAILLTALMLVGCLSACSITPAGELNDVANGTTGVAETTADTTAEATVDEGAASDLKYVQDKGELVVGITDYAPMNYLENGEWTGFDTEFAKAVGEKLGVTIKFVEIDWDNKIFELDSKAIDCVWNGMTLTNEVMSAMSCSVPYVVNAQVLVMDKDKIANYATVDSLKDISFVAEAGSAGAAAITDAGYTVTEVDLQTTALMEVASGSADACVIDITMANAMTGEGTSYANLTYGVAFTSEEYGIGFRKGSDLTAKVNEIIAELNTAGTLPALAEKYDLTLALD